MRQIKLSSLDQSLQQQIREYVGKSAVLDVRLPDSAKKTILKFIDQEAHDSKKLTTDGKVLDGNWVGGRRLAWWENGKLHIAQPSGIHSQTIANFIKKNVSKAQLAD